MQADESVIAAFASHEAADSAVKKLTAAGFPLTSLSVIGKGYHTEEKAAGFYNIGERVMFWGSRGAFWGGLWGLFLGGLFLTVPVVGHVIVLGYLAATTVSVVEGAVVVGGLSALGAALTSIGVPRDSVIRYETALKADSFLVMAHGSTQEVARARDVLAAAGAASIDVHPSVTVKDERLALAGA